MSYASIASHFRRFEFPVGKLACRDGLMNDKFLLEETMVAKFSGILRHSRRIPKGLPPPQAQLRSMELVLERSVLVVDGSVCHSRSWEMTGTANRDLTAFEKLQRLISTSCACSRTNADHEV
mmetsp:Transcript_20030/g.80261  ORF Transcript_20030/g.80261 Transcript_20030/m.80261 type:complete len:122 (+) Transcript_20030:261-626(+)